MKDTHREITPSKKIQVYAKSINTEVFKVYVKKAVVLGGTNELNWFLRNFPGPSKRTLCCCVSLCTNYF